MGLILLFEMTKHEHQCLCGATWLCIINILPVAGGGRIWCREWTDAGICDRCLENIATAQGREVLQAMSELEADPLIAYQARQRRNESTAVT
jgi:hypothetical protein